MALSIRHDPYLSFNFAVELYGLVRGGFTEVSGLQLEVETHEYREGGLNAFVHKLAGPVSYPSNLVLKRGIAEVDGLWLWYQGVLRGVILRKPVSVILLDSAGAETRRWDFAEAYPVKWSGPDLNASSDAVAVETVELAHNGLISIL